MSYASTFISEKLNDTNYVIWSEEIFAFLQTKRAGRIILGTETRSVDHSLPEKPTNFTEERDKAGDLATRLFIRQYILTSDDPFITRQKGEELIKAEFQKHSLKPLSKAPLAMFVTLFLSYRGEIQTAKAAVREKWKLPVNNISSATKAEVEHLLELRDFWSVWWPFADAKFEHRRSYNLKAAAESDRVAAVKPSGVGGSWERWNWGERQYVTKMGTLWCEVVKDVVGGGGTAYNLCSSVSVLADPNSDTILSMGEAEQQPDPLIPLGYSHPQPEAREKWNADDERATSRCLQLLASPLGPHLPHS
ncbi:hypothetical protein BT69DRAFT_1329900 [Atractiella rhizophila]|nr:hypothetical protein BT69DRAFT_1329900 [Atractiella rhizophila]